MKYILFLLVITTVVLLLPYKRIKILKKILASITIALAVAMGVKTIFIHMVLDKTGTPITVTVTGEKSEKSEGTEVWIKGAIIDGKWYEADEIFENTWISKDNCLLGWRNYNQTKNLANEIRGNLPFGNQRELIFEGNKWHGKSIVKIEGQKISVDTFSSGEKNTDINIKMPLSGRSVESQVKKKSLIIFSITLIVFFVFFMFLYYLEQRKKTDKDMKIDYKKIDNREVWADLLRVVSAFTVVYLHCTCNIYNNFTENMQIWYKYLYINSFTTFAVPCFFLLSGTFMLRKSNSLKSLLTKKIPKLIIPLFFWSIVYILIRHFYFGEKISVFARILKIPFEAQYYHLWFMYPLIGFYFLSPIISYIYYNLDKNLKIYGITILCFIPIITNTLMIYTGKQVNMPWFAMGFPELGLFLLGRYIYDNRENIFGKEKIYAAFAVIGFGSIVVSTYYISLRSNSPQKDFFGYSRIPVMMMSISIFMFFISLEPKLKGASEKFKNFIGNLSCLSMGIYFVHMLMKEFIGNKFDMFTSNSGSNLNMLLGAILYFLCSAMLCLVLSSIPYVRCLGSNKDIIQIGKKTDFYK